MARKREKPEGMVAKLQQVEVLRGQGCPRGHREGRGHTALPPAIQPRLQSHRAGLRQAQGAPAQGRSAHRRGPRNRHRRRPRRLHANRMRQLLHKLRLRARLIRKCSRSAPGPVGLDRPHAEAPFHRRQGPTGTHRQDGQPISAAPALSWRHRPGQRASCQRHAFSMTPWRARRRLAVEDHPAQQAEAGRHRAGQPHGQDGLCAPEGGTDYQPA